METAFDESSYRESLMRLHAFLQARGMKWTRQRDAVLRAFLRAEDHPTVHEVAVLARKDYPGLGTATAYRTMRLLAEAGVALEHRFGDGQGRFEVAMDREHHDHLICEECGLIIEFDDERIERLQEQAAAQHGFQPRSHRLEIYGLCKSCR
jgi:Fur family ferric uptake transcriptional regulator